MTFYALNPNSNSEVLPYTPADKDDLCQALASTEDGASSIVREDKPLLQFEDGPLVSSSSYSSYKEACAPSPVSSTKSEYRATYYVNTPKGNAPFHTIEYTSGDKDGHIARVLHAGANQATGFLQDGGDLSLGVRVERWDADPLTQSVSVYSAALKPLGQIAQDYFALDPDLKDSNPLIELVEAPDPQPVLASLAKAEPVSQEDFSFSEALASAPLPEGEADAVPALATSVTEIYAGNGPNRTGKSGEGLIQVRAGEQVLVRINGAEVAGAKAELVDANGVVIKTLKPQGELSYALLQDIPAGEYSVRYTTGSYGEDKLDTSSLIARSLNTTQIAQVVSQLGKKVPIQIASVEAPITEEGAG